MPQVQTQNGLRRTNHSATVNGKATNAVAFKIKVDLIDYSPPTDGFLSYLPTSWVPYAQLMRLERPAGLIGFYMPSLLGLVYGASIAHSLISPVELFQKCLFFVLLNILIRGAACTWNDNIDQDYDRQVERCRQRPIARGAVSTTAGHTFAFLQTGILVLLFRQLPPECAPLAGFMGALYTLYPFCKRFTHYPQLILGVPLALSILISCYALHVDPLGESQRAVATACLCAAEILWTMIYDTIYAHQDINDDIKAGVRSMAVRFRDTTKMLCSILAVFQVALLVGAGKWGVMPANYFLVGCGGSAASLAVIISVVDLEIPASCARWFKLGFCLVGGSMAGGFFVRYLERLMGGI